MLTIKKFDERCDGPNFYGGKYIAYLGRKDHGYVMNLTLKNVGRLIIHLFNRRSIRPYGEYAKG